eukprot:8144607-Pyramimonas_sp.AAC.1
MAPQSPTAATRSRAARRIGGCGVARRSPLRWGRGVARRSPLRLPPPKCGPQSAGGLVETSNAMGAPGSGPIGA